MRIDLLTIDENGPSINFLEIGHSSRHGGATVDSAADSI
jgi:hypothetical protein